MATRVGTPRMTYRSRQLVITLTTNRAVAVCGDDEGGWLRLSPLFLC